MTAISFSTRTIADQPAPSCCGKRRLAGARRWLHDGRSVEMMQMLPAFLDREVLPDLASP